MPNAFLRSWEITKLSFNVMKQDNELLLFPLLAGVFSLLFIAAVLFPTIIASILKDTGIFYFGVFEYFLLFVIYFGLTFIATFFNVCVVYTTKVRFKGGNATFAESIKFALSRLHLIFYWSLISATVGLILRLIDRMAERTGRAGQLIANIVASLLGMAWSIVTIFVVPSMVYHNLGPVEAIKKSAATFKKTWGESLIRYFGMGLIEFLFIITGIVLAIPLIFLALGLGVYGILAIVIIVIAYIVIVSIVFSIANTIFNTALYVYADTNKIPKGYSKDIMNNAFRSRKSKIVA